MRRLIRKAISFDENDEYLENMAIFEKQSFKIDYLKVQKEDFMTGIKTNNIFSGLDIFKSYKGGVNHLNKILKVLSTDR